MSKVTEFKRSRPGCLQHQREAQFFQDQRCPAGLSWKEVGGPLEGGTLHLQSSEEVCMHLLADILLLGLTLYDPCKTVPSCPTIALFNL